MVRLEVCVDSAAGLEAAIAGGADRVELCSALGLGGLTPGPGLMALAAKAPIPVVAMIRPRAGDFCWSEDDIAAQLDDISAVRRAGLAGVVIGANLADGRLDPVTLERLAEAAEGLDLTLHRSIDLAPNALAAVDIARDLGIKRILSSGGKPRAIDGLEQLARMADHAGDDLSIMPGSGVTPKNVARIRAATNCQDVHASCSLKAETPKKMQDFGFAAPVARRTSVDLVCGLKTALTS